MGEIRHNKVDLPTKDSFGFSIEITTRWMDNDIYGHVNNVVYYSFFDTVINRYLIDKGGLDIHQGSVIGLAVDTGCRFFRPITYPDHVQACLRVAHVGSSSVRYEVGLFCNDDSECCAFGHFVHVFVDRQTRRPVPMTAELKKALSTLLSRPSVG